MTDTLERQGLYRWKIRLGIKALMEETHLSEKWFVRFGLRFTWMCEFLSVFLPSETQNSECFLLLNVKSKANLFIKSKFFDTCGRAVSRVKSNPLRHLISCLCSICQLCTSPTRVSCDLASVMINVECMRHWRGSASLGVSRFFVVVLFV